MAATATVTSFKETSTGVKVLKVAFVAHTDNSNATATLTGVTGKKLYSVVMVNGATGQGAATDLDVTDSLSEVNLTATNGDNKLAANSGKYVVFPDTAYVGWIIPDKLTVTLSANSVASGTCDVYLVFDSK